MDDVKYYKGQIAQLDKTLGMCRYEWISARGQQKMRWSERIDRLLAERSKLMQLRDGRSS